MVGKRYVIALTTEEREQLNRLIRAGKHAARVISRARILLRIDEGWKAPQIAAARDVSEGTAHGVKGRYADGGLHGVLRDRGQANRFLSQTGREGGGPLDCPGVQRRPGGPPPLDPAVAGRPDGGIGSGGKPFMRDGAAQAQKNVRKPWRKQSAGGGCIPKVGG